MKKHLWLALVAAFSAVSHVHAFTPFKVKDIRVNGLERIPEGTVYNYLQLQIGDALDAKRAADAIKALYATGFFKDVRLERDGDALVVAVVERPSIAEIELEGNDAIESDKLKEGLKQIGITEAQSYDASLVDRVEQELNRQYFNLGHYGVAVKSEVTVLPRNRIKLKINIAEGDAARIKQIDIVGNKVFSDAKLVDEFQLSEKTLFSFISKADQYSSQKLAADLESLRSYYLDRGYVNFQVDSTQVSISPDKKDMYVTINVSEGDKYTITKIDYVGNLIIPRKKYINAAKPLQNAVFSRREITAATELMREKLGDQGYAFATINPVPKTNEADKTVELTFYVEPKSRVYVRRINIVGNLLTEDAVIRREFRQQEGAWLSTSKLERSRTRVDRLGFFESVATDLKPVPGTNDQVDVELTVVERPSGTLMASVGYQENVGVTLDFSITKENFMGTGKRVGITLRNNAATTVYEFSYTNPYYTDSGVSRGFNIFRRETNAEEQDISRYATNETGGEMFYRIPVSEFNSWRLGMQYEHTDLSINGKPECVGEETPSADNCTNSTPAPNEVLGFVDKFGDQFDTVSFDLGWSYDSRNKRVFAEKGVMHQINGTLATPGGDLEYYKLSYSQNRYYSMTKALTLGLEANFGYGDGFGDTEDLPFFEHYFVGGPRSVRGYRTSSLGPVDSNGDAFGGSFRTVGNSELIFPLPFAPEEKSMRMSLFVDYGMAFEGPGEFDFAELRYSSGISAVWISPLGAMSFSFAKPFHYQETDELENFQFTLGSAFY
jgi:outer membrane protein insertion porin family